MNSTPKTTQLFECIKLLSDSVADKLLKAALDALNLENTDFETCPYCGGTHFVRYGKKRGKQRFFVRTAKKFSFFILEVLFYIISPANPNN